MLDEYDNLDSARVPHSPTDADAIFFRRMKHQRYVQSLRHAFNAILIL